MKKREKAGSGKTWHKEIVCLPPSYRDENMKIPRGSSRDHLFSLGLIGKISLHCEMTEDDVKKEVRSVFHRPIKGDFQFPFTYLQSTGMLPFCCKSR